MRLALSLLVAVLGALTLYVCTACEIGGCTEASCESGASVQLTFADHSWPAGAYRAEITLDDETHTCSFAYPADRPANGTTSDLSCEPTAEGGVFRASLEQETRCTEERTAQAVTQRCDLLPEQYSLHVHAAADPEHVRVRVERDGALVKEHDAPLRYTEYRPNGPDCEPTCRTAELTVLLDP